MDFGLLFLCPSFGKSGFAGNSQILDPVIIFIIFPIPALYFGQIPKILLQTLWELYEIWTLYFSINYPYQLAKNKYIK